MSLRRSSVTFFGVTPPTRRAGGHPVAGARRPIPSGGCPCLGRGSQWPQRCPHLLFPAKRHAPARLHLAMRPVALVAHCPTHGRNCAELAGTETTPTRSTYLALDRPTCRARLPETKKARRVSDELFAFWSFHADVLAQPARRFDRRLGRRCGVLRAARPAGLLHERLSVAGSITRSQYETITAPATGLHGPVSLKSNCRHGFRTARASQPPFGPLGPVEKEVCEDGVCGRLGRPVVGRAPFSSDPADLRLLAFRSEQQRPISGLWTTIAPKEVWKGPNRRLGARRQGLERPEPAREPQGQKTDPKGSGSQQTF